MGTDIRALAAGGVLVLVLGALVAATSEGAGWFGVGSVPESHGAQPAPEEDAEPSGDSEQTNADGSEAPRPPRPQAAPWVQTLALALVSVLVAGCVLIIGTSFRLVLRRRRLTGGRLARSVPGGYADDDPPPADDESLHDILESRLASLGQGTPRNAIVAAWVRLEEFAGSEGLPRHESDTPSEFVARALAAYRLDEAASQRLAELYREARFSEHPLTESHRDEARTCLERLVSKVGAP